MAEPSPLSLLDPAREIRTSRGPVDPNAVRVFNNQTQSLEWIAPEEAEAKFRAGLVNLPSDHPISVQDADGATKAVDPGAISEELNAGGSLISDRERHARELQQEYGGIKGAAIAAGAGLARSATLGASDQAAMLFAGSHDEEVRDALEASNEAHGLARTVGETAGMFLTPGLGGVAGAVEKGAGSALARATGGAITREAGGLGARALARGAEYAARGAVEGGGLGLQNVFSEAALGDDPNVTGEKIAAGIGHGAIAGALVGAVAGAGTEAAATGLKAAKARAAPMLEKLANREAWRDINSAQSVTKEIMRRTGGVEEIGATARAEGLMDPRLSVEEQFAKAQASKNRVGEAIGDLYRQSGATGSPKELVAKLDEMIADVDKNAGLEGVARGLRQYRASLLEKLTAAAKEAGAKVPEEEAATGGVNVIRKISQEQQLLEAERAAMAAGNEAKATEFRQIREAVYGVRKTPAPPNVLEHEVPMAELWRQRRALDRLVYVETKALDPNLRVEMLRNFRGKFQDYIEEVGDRAGDFSEPLRDLNKRYQHLSLINDALETKTARQLTNRRFSLTDTIMQGGGNAGAVTALASGHPLVAAGALVSGLANKMLRERGPRVASWMLGQTASLEGIAAHVGAVDTAIDRAITDFVERPAPTESGVFRRAPTSPAPPDRSEVAKKDEAPAADRFTAKAEMIRAAAEHPELATAVGSHFAPIADAAPEAAAAAAKATTRAIQYLAERLPQSQRLDPLQPSKSEPPSAAERDRWLRIEAAVEDPTAWMRDVAAGRVDPETSKAVAAVYPALFDRMRKGFLDKMAERPRDVSRQERLRIHDAFGLPTTPGVDPAAIAAKQQAFATAQKQSGPPPSRRSSHKLSDAYSLETASERIAKGD